MASHSAVIERFAERGRPLRGKNVYTVGDTIYSYGSHFPMAIAYDDTKMFLINGDTYSSTTSHHQASLRGLLSRTKYTRVIIPFSILNRAGLDKSSVRLIEEGQEINEYSCETCGPLTAERFYHHGYQLNHKRHHRHLLAPSLIMARRDGIPAYFLSGFDETARGFGGGYFFSELPHPVKTIEEAFLSLQPEPVKEAIENGISVKRQGDIFGIPTDITLRELKKIGKVMPLRRMKPLMAWDSDETIAYEPTDIIEGPGTYIRGNIRPQLLGTNHYATEAYQVDNEIYARGMLYHRPSFREADHMPIKLGKEWHRIYRNTALNSWSINGRID